MSTPTKPEALPDFDLAPLEGIDPKAFAIDTPLGQFVLTLACVFNDLKGAYYALERIVRVEPIAEEHLAWKGQLTGMAIHISRSIAGCIREPMVLIEKEQKIVRSAAFAQLLARIPVRARKGWQRIQEVAVDQTTPGTSEQSTLLVELRNNISFHYGPKALANGYRQFFFGPPRTYNDRAVFSDGHSMEETRFYFTDAAAEETFDVLTGLNRSDVEKKVSDLAQDVNDAMAIEFGFPPGAANTLRSDVTSIEEIEAGGGRFYFFR